MTRPTFEMAFTARPEHIDELGHVNNAVWVQWIQEVAVAHWDAVADPAHKDAYFWVIVRHEIDYLRAALEGDRVVGRTWVGEAPKGARFDRHMEFTGNDGRAVRPRADLLGDHRQGRRGGRSGSRPRWWRRSSARRKQSAMSRADPPRLLPLVGRLPRADRAQPQGRRLRQPAGQSARQASRSRDDYRALNPQGLVPMLEIDGHRLTQSLAIIIYLDQPLPRAAADAAPTRPTARMCGRWRWRSPATSIRSTICACSNISRASSGCSRRSVDAWYAHWISEGFTALEAMAAPRAGDFLFGDAPTIADICLVPQMYNARRFNVPLDAYPTLLRADANASKLEAFAAAHPTGRRQPQ